MSGPPLQISPIEDADGPAVSEFLRAHLNDKVPVSAWMSLIAPPWADHGPNHGFQLRAGAALAGVCLAVYSRRELRGEGVTVCNLAAFCVLPEFRLHSVRLLQRVLAQPNLQFTDLSPSGNVIALNTRLGFTELDTSTRLTPNLPWPRSPGLRLTEDPHTMSATLCGRDATVHTDHQRAPAARHLLVSGPDSYAYLVFRRDRRRGLPLFASPLYVGGDRELLARAWPQVGAHLLLRHRIPATLAERRVLGFIPRLGRDLAAPRHKMFRGDALAPETVDYLYSELVLLEW